VAGILALVISTDFFANVLVVENFDADEAACRGKQEQAYAKRKAAAPTPKTDDKADRDDGAREYCIQRRSALASERQAHFAKVTLYLGIATLLAAIGAAIAAGIAAKATRDTVATMQDTARTELRAFVTPTNFHFIYHTVSMPGDEGRVVHTWELRPVWENSGTTPARRVINHVSYDVFAAPPAANFAYPDRWIGAQQPFVSFLIGPRASVQGEEVRIPVNLLEGTRRGGARVYVWGWVEYSDALRDTPRHRTEFCVWLDPQGDPRVPSPGHVIARFVGPHNGADDDCMKRPTTT
jgi:hypothetical protein